MGCSAAKAAEFVVPSFLNLQKEEGGGGSNSDSEEISPGEGEGEEEPDDDAYWYKKEVGEKPSADMFSGSYFIVVIL